MRLNNGNKDHLINNRVLNSIQFSISVRQSFKMRMEKQEDGKSERREVRKSGRVWREECEEGAQRSSKINEVARRFYIDFVPLKTLWTESPNPNTLTYTSDFRTSDS